MTRLALVLFFLLLLPIAALADHITGGEVFYTFLGRQNGYDNYRITVKVFMRCNSGRTFNNPTVVSIFDKGAHARVSDHEVSLARTETIQLTDPNKCITDPPLVCYNVGYYELNVALPPSSAGYVVAAQFVYRIAGIRNLVSFYSNVGATYTAEIPTGTNNGAANNSARFVGSDLVAICANNNFTYSFAAEDKDGDELRYYFCDAYQGGNFRNGAAEPPAPPPYFEVPYNGNFLGSSPLGAHVRIDAKTGLITGTAPGEGIYVVTVCVEEVRDGKVIATQRKDLQIFIASCTIASASLLPQYALCEDTKTLSVTNGSNSPLIRTYNWEVLDRTGNIVTSATTPAFEHTFTDTGMYRLKLVVNRGGECADSNLSPVRVYPGLVPGFEAEGVCANKPTRFLDQSTTTYGTITAWEWAFGENGIGTSQTALSNPTLSYTGSGNRQVGLKVTTSLGCAATTSKTISITDRPPLNLLFKDTLICIGDVLQLEASSRGSYQWLPQAGVISGGNTATPNVAPRTTTLFVAELNQEGCINRDSVLVRVANGVQLQTSGDTSICAGDTIRLRAISNALRYTWQPAQAVLQPGVPNPQVVPTGTDTRFLVTGHIGGCSETAVVNVRAVPLPRVNAGQDTVICFKTTAFLHGSTDGTRFSWSQPQTLQNAASLTTEARPVGTTAYVLTATGTDGCPKPATDTVLVQVQAPVRPFAGRDTAVVLGQPLQLQASGGTVYQWSPALGLSSTNLPNPVALFSESFGGTIRYTVQVATPEGCMDSASVQVRIFDTKPDIFIPTGFTPNGDGRNDVLRPIAAGMGPLEIFSVYNRWGQLLFSSRDGRGWDGTLNGAPQSAGVYVWLVRATDFGGRPYVKKGTVTLVR